VPVIALRWGVRGRGLERGLCLCHICSDLSQVPALSHAHAYPELLAFVELML